MTISSLSYVMDHNRAAVLRLLRYCYLTVGGAKRPRLLQLKEVFIKITAYVRRSLKRLGFRCPFMRVDSETWTEESVVTRQPLSQDWHKWPTTDPPAANHDQPERQLAQISRPRIGRRPED